MPYPHLGRMMADEKKHDETVEGGAYLVNGVLVNAEGVPISKKEKAELKDLQAEQAETSKKAEDAAKDAKAETDEVVITKRTK